MVNMFIYAFIIIYCIIVGVFKNKYNVRRFDPCLSFILVAETSVQQASKQVQVDLQDLGYETCGRSENEAEREDASSPGTKQTRLLLPHDLFPHQIHPC